MNRTVLENWKPVVGYESFYEVSDRGRVRSKDRQVWNGRGFYNKKGRILKQSKTTTGYWKVELSKDGEKKSKKVHRLVAESFIPLSKGKPLINHKDGNPLNNKVENLEWCNQSENMKHAYETGLIPSNFIKYKEQIKEEYKTNKNSTINGLSRKYQCSIKSIRELLDSEGIRIRNISESQDVYKIDRQKMVIYFKEGLSNKEIANKFSTNSTLIATYRYKHKKGELKI